MICPNCQTENRDQAKFCDQCGFQLSGLIAQVAADVASSDEAVGQSLESSDVEPPAIAEENR